MMKTKMIYMILLFSSILFGGCVRDVIDDVPGTDRTGDRTRWGAFDWSKRSGQRNNDRIYDRYGWTLRSGKCTL